MGSRRSILSKKRAWSRSAPAARFTSWPGQRRHEDLGLDPGHLHVGGVGHRGRHHALLDQEHVGVERGAFVARPHQVDHAVEADRAAVGQGGLDQHHVVELEELAVGDAHPELEGHRVEGAEDAADASLLRVEAPRSAAASRRAPRGRRADGPADDLGDRPGGAAAATRDRRWGRGSGGPAGRGRESEASAGEEAALASARVRTSRGPARPRSRDARRPRGPNRWPGRGRGAGTTSSAAPGPADQEERACARPPPGGAGGSRQPAAGSCRHEPLHEAHHRAGGRGEEAQGPVEEDEIGRGGRAPRPRRASLSRMARCRPWTGRPACCRGRLRAKRRTARPRGTANLERQPPARHQEAPDLLAHAGRSPRAGWPPPRRTPAGRRRPPPVLEQPALLDASHPVDEEDAARRRTGRGRTGGQTVDSTSSRPSRKARRRSPESGSRRRTRRPTGRGGGCRRA